MKVLLLAYDMGLHGGVGTFSYELSNALAEKGVEVIVVAAGRLKGGSSLEAGVNFKLYALRKPSIPPKDVLFYMVNMHEISKIVSREKPDVIHDTSSALGFMPWLSKIAPVVATVHGSPLLGHLRMVYGSVEDRLRAKLFEYSHVVPTNLLSLIHKPRVDMFVFVSKSCLADALVHTPLERREELRKKSTVIYNGLSLKAMDEIARQAQARSTPESLVFMGRLMEYKGVSRLIKAFKHVIEELPEAVLHVIGMGPEYKGFVELARRLEVDRNIVFHGWLPRRRALEILASSKVLVHPSLYESFGYVIAEAYALGKPVIAHRAPYSIELVEGMSAGFTVNTFNTREFAETMLLLLTDKSLYAKLSMQARLVAERYFNVNKVAEEYMKVYERVLEAR